MKKLKCSGGCGSEHFDVSVTVDAYKQLSETIERLPVKYFTCSSCGAPAEEEK